MNLELLTLLLLAVVIGLLVYLLLQQRETRALLAQPPQNVPFDQLAAYLYLRDRLDLKQGLSYTPFWSAAPDFLKLIADHCLDTRPTTIVECSSGLTSLVLAKCCEINGTGRVFSLEDGGKFASKSRGHITRYGLERFASVIHAPLTDVTLDGVEYQWYGLDGLPPGGIDMLVIDGPVGFIQRHSRYPALPLLYERLADRCVVFLDDAGREDEREIVTLWQAAYPSARHEYIKTERGCSVLTLEKS